MNALMFKTRPIPKALTISPIARPLSFRAGADLTHRKNKEKSRAKRALRCAIFNYQGL
jgi:hypothetical protein